MIILNDKDADFVANICRQKLKAAELAYQDAFERMQSLHEASNAILDGMDEDASKTKEHIEPEFEKAKTKLTNDFMQIRNEYTKIINLMMCGSNLLGE